MAVVPCDRVDDDAMVVRCDLSGGVVSHRPNDPTPADDVGREQRADLAVWHCVIEGLRRGELALEALRDGLEKPLRPRKVLQPVLAEIPQLEVRELLVLD